ncbi:uncharacterized protein LOC142632780 [Castanea sativa]|uniref:uncharacterized protein LOC142632780 n=1 Tax=Castanea sativa TaxID=21020 RepID=UPI003F649887
MDAVARTFTPIWRTRNGFQIRNLGNHKLLFIIDNKLDAERVLQNEPWSFDKHLIVFQCYNKDTVLEDYNVNEASLWVQVHNIPIGYMDRETTEEICSIVGKVVKTEGSKDSGGDSFIRVRVNVDGLRNQRTIQELTKFVWAQDPSVVFLAETWTDEARLKKLCDDLQLDEI